MMEKVTTAKVMYRLPPFSGISGMDRAMARANPPESIARCFSILGICRSQHRLNHHTPARVTGLVMPAAAASWKRRLNWRVVIGLSGPSPGNRQRCSSGSPHHGVSGEPATIAARASADALQVHLERQECKHVLERDDAYQALVLDHH